MRKENNLTDLLRHRAEYQRIQLFEPNYEQRSCLCQADPKKTFRYLTQWLHYTKD